jgi:DNA-binding transcriptional ArsR family regulator
VPDSTTEAGEIAEIRQRLERQEAMATVRSAYARRRADRRARERQAAIRRRALLAGEVAAARAEVAGSGEARAEQVRTTRTLALCLLLPVMVAFGAWSTAGVQAGMVAMLGLAADSPAAAMAWAVEPALLGTVAGIIVIRARLQAAGGDLDERARTVEFGALTISVVLNMAGHWPTEFTGAAVASVAGHALGPIGAAGAAYMLAVVQDGVADADPWTLPDGTRAPSIRDSAPAVEDQEHEHEQTASAPRWEHRPGGRHERVGGERIAGWVHDGGRTLLPIECAVRARARVQALAEGARAVAQIEDWRAREAAATRRTRMRAEAIGVAAGGAPRALLRGEHIVPDLESARGEHAQEDQRAHRPPARVAPAAEARRRAGLGTRERIVAHIAQHPGHDAEQIAEEIRVHPSTVRRHLRAMSG